MNDNITLKKLDYNEQGQILDIISQDDVLKTTFGGIRKTISRILNSSYISLIQKDNSTVGFIMLVYDKINNMHEMDIGIISSYRKQGYGTKALEIMREIITKEQAKINIKIKKENVAVIIIVTKNNFALVKQNDKYFYYSNDKIKKIKRRTQ